MMTYYRRVISSIIPKRRKDFLAMVVLVPVIAIPGYHIFFKSPPNVTIYSETSYPKEIRRGETLMLNYDLSWDRTCEMTAARFITASDNIEYKTLEDTKTLLKDIRFKYTARIPIPVAIPPGAARVRSDFYYSCDWWSEYISPIHVRGQDRNIMILPSESKTSWLHIPQNSWF